MRLIFRARITPLIVIVMIVIQSCTNSQPEGGENHMQPSPQNMGKGMMKNQQGGNSQTNNSSATAQTGGAWVAPAFAKTLPNPEKDDPQAVSNGKDNYVQLCMPCHGLDGAGDGPSAASFNPPPANLLADSVKNETDGELFWKITTGKGIMTSYEKILSEKRRWEIVEYIRALQEKAKKS